MVTLQSLFGVPGPKVFYYSLNGLQAEGDDTSQNSPITVQNPIFQSKPAVTLLDSGIDGLPLIKLPDDEQTDDNTPFPIFKVPEALYAPALTQAVLGLLIDLLAE